MCVCATNVGAPTQADPGSRFAAVSLLSALTLTLFFAGLAGWCGVSRQGNLTWHRKRLYFQCSIGTLGNLQPVINWLICVRNNPASFWTSSLQDGWLITHSFSEAVEIKAAYHLLQGCAGRSRVPPQKRDLCVRSDRCAL
jgi:hypothetical protein